MSSDVFVEHSAEVKRVLAENEFWVCIPVNQAPVNTDGNGWMAFRKDGKCSESVTL